MEINLQVNVCKNTKLLITQLFYHRFFCFFLLSFCLNLSDIRSHKITVCRKRGQFKSVPSHSEDIQ